jgi:hypothetical protein
MQSAYEKNVVSILIYDQSLSTATFLFNSVQKGYTLQVREYWQVLDLAQISLLTSYGKVA